MNHDRMIPQDVTAEAALVGCVLLGADALAEVRGLVQAEDILHPRLRLLYDAICRYGDQSGRHPEIAELTPFLTATEPYDRLARPGVSGQDFLQSVIDGVASTVSVARYAHQVRNAAALRSIIGLCEKSGQDAYALDQDADELIDRLEAELHQTRTHGIQDGVVHIGDATDELLEHTDRVYRGELSPGLLTGLRSVDEVIGGFEPGDLITLAGETSSGKTALADTIARHVGLAGHTVLIVSCEMRTRERAKRLLQAQADIPGQYIKLAKSLKPEDWTVLQRGAEELRGTQIWLYAAGKVRPCDVAMQARRVARKEGGLGLLVVDYLQLLAPTARNKGESTAHIVGQMAWELKALAMDMGIPVMLLSQLNRAATAGGHPPSVHALKESGDIENHSNIVLLLHRPTDAAERIRRVWLSVAKSRDGQTTPWPPKVGSVVLDWRPETTTFFDGEGEEKP